MSPSWEEIWQGEAMPPWDLGGPSPVVLRLARRHLPEGSRVLVPGCGSAWEAEELARAGHRVTGLDLAPTALERARRRVGELPALGLREGNFLDLPAELEGCFDAVVEHTCFCTFPEGELRGYVRAARRALVPGGMVLGAFLDFEAEGGPPYGTSPEALRELFEPAFSLERLEPAPELFPPVCAGQLEVVMRLTGE